MWPHHRESGAAQGAGGVVVMVMVLQRKVGTIYFCLLFCG